MWTALLQAIGSFSAGAIAWVVLEFVGRPLRKFYDLRGEVIHVLAQTANVPAAAREIRNDVGEASGQIETCVLTEQEKSDLREAMKSIRNLGSDLRVFSLNESRALYLVKSLGYDPALASGGLYGLSNSIHTYGAERHARKCTIQKALLIPEL
jgi:hypothetical protein